MHEQTRCAYLLPKKNRKCRMLVKRGNLYCGEHAIYELYNNERVVCPLDPKHTVNKADLEEHIKKRCNERLPQVPWIVEGLNSKNDGRKAESYNTWRDWEFDESVLNAVIEKIRVAYEKIKNEVCISKMKTLLIESFMEQEKNMDEAHRKHLVQYSSIIGHLKDADLLYNEEELCVIDFGSGKAELSYWMSKVSPKCRFLLVDNQGMRNKYDNKAIKENSDVKMHRIRCSIENLDLSKVEWLKKVETLVAVSKHFCGNATDCGIRCLENGAKNGVDFLGFALAPCCHHKTIYSEVRAVMFLRYVRASYKQKSDYKDSSVITSNNRQVVFSCSYVLVFGGLPELGTYIAYIGDSFLASHGIASEVDFQYLRYVASWAVCGMSSHGFQVNSFHTEAENEDLKSLAVNTGKVLQNVRMDKEKIGRKAKVLLEFGRAAYLERLGYDVRLYEYVNFNISPENLLIVGKKKTAKTGDGKERKHSVPRLQSDVCRLD